MRLSSRYTLGGVAALLVIALVSLGSFFGSRALASPSSQQPTFGFMYTVKFTCVPEVGASELVGVEAPFLPGLYRTAINIHNPQPVAVRFTKKAVVARSEDIVPRGKISERRAEELGPDEALDVDCRDILDLLGGVPPVGNEPVGNGFVVIETTRELDVVAVYTHLFVEIDKEITGFKNVVHTGPIAEQPPFEEFPRVFEVDPETGTVLPRQPAQDDRGQPPLPPPGEPGNPGIPVAHTSVIGESGTAIHGAGTGIGLGVGVGAGASVDVEYIQPKRIRRGQVISALGALGD